MSDPHSAHRDAFKAQQRRLVEQLVGRMIREIWLWEMAFIESGPRGAPVFEHEALPFVQANVLQLEMADGGVLALLTYQDHEDCPLLVEERSLADRRLTELETDGLFRTRVFSEFPLGPVSSAVGHYDTEGRLMRLTLTVGSSVVHLCSGEVYEGPNGCVRIVEAEESVLVFLSDAALAATCFNQELSLVWA